MSNIRISPLYFCADCKKWIYTWEHALKHAEPNHDENFKVVAAEATNG